ncbi:MAG: c-type cytochrome [Burkholderiales bacterium]|nr:c-type cytochrome [Burkholderiales bacterium]
MHKVARAASAFLLTICAGQVLAEGPVQAPKLGKPISAEQAAKWDLNVFSDGAGLPPGSGTAVEGSIIYDRQCASCHGEGGRGGAAEELAGGSHALTSETPDKSIGIYWPYATTIFDFTRRAMPMNAPGSLSADQVYAVTAYLLYANKIIGEKDAMDGQTLPKVKMPNREGFIWIDAKPAASK